jgi:hypothetical protein
LNKCKRYKANLGFAASYGQPQVTQFDVLIEIEPGSDDLVIYDVPNMMRSDNNEKLVTIKKSVIEQTRDFGWYFKTLRPVRFEYLSWHPKDENYARVRLEDVYKEMEVLKEERRELEGML